MYEWQNGVAATAMVDIIKQILFNSNESTCGKSAIYPQATRPTVFVIPIIDNKYEAEFLSIPYKKAYAFKVNLNGALDFVKEMCVIFTTYI